MSGADWEARLEAQGVDAKRIADAKTAARTMAGALQSVAFSPADPIAPEQFLQILAEHATRRDGA